MGRVETEQRLGERRIWLIAILLAAALFVFFFHAFPAMPKQARFFKPQTPTVVFQPRRFQGADATAQQAISSPALIALPFRAISTGNNRPGIAQTDPKPSLDAPVPDFAKPQPPRNTGPTMDEWLIRLRRERQRPPAAETPLAPLPVPAKNAPSWNTSGGLSGLETDVTPLLQLGEEDSLSGVFTAWVVLNEFGRVAHLIIETDVPDKALAAKLDRAFRECVFFSGLKNREGCLTIRYQ